ncbi:RdgB/HAM1 family non-canonical purine NTP pyrophosphatase [Gynurincola endophyticus]|uniref:RdgB/HAM1 family non-canonical purine NTP pyrophosphatase n=1 Tax=Gynurincola endophyticus TaxID=2479004 RepID=UPI000F8CC61C|nr:RdgB/HAM1 family non-canonical purine NTP pyrophosphatase [Gynurincola endophyticus]
MEIIFATNNANKVAEIQAAIGESLKVIPLKDAGILIDIPEPHDTLEANATEKSTVIHRLTGKNCFSEDTGLEITALNGAPGVKSARYAGEDRSFDANIDLVLQQMQGKADRSARFRTVISLIWDDREYQFEGICEGKILEQRSGSNGFGYDPVFVPDGGETSFANMTMEQKNEFSHRKKAVQQLIEFLSQLQ